MKKLLSTILVLGLVLSSTCQSFAWGGYAHWYIAKNLTGSSLSTSYKNAYASGCLLADLGKTALDLTYTNSDSKSFSNEIVDIANNGDYSTKAKYFASGWKAHYLQDNKGALSNITGGPSNTIFKKGWVDYYLRDKASINCPINDTDTYYINYDLIVATYESLDDITPTENNIDAYIIDEFTSYTTQLFAGKTAQSTVSSSEKKSIIAELKRTANLCDTLYSSLDSGVRLLANSQKNGGIISVASQRDEENNIENPDLNDSDKELLVEDIREKAFDNFKEIRENDYVELEKTPGEDEGEYYVRFIIKDSVNYNKEINEVVKMMDENDLTFEEVFESEQ